MSAGADVYLLSGPKEKTGSLPVLETFGPAIPQQVTTVEEQVRWRDEFLRRIGVREMIESMSTLLIQHGTVLDPSRTFERRADVLIRDGKIAAIGLGPWSGGPGN